MQKADHTQIHEPSEATSDQISRDIRKLGLQMGAELVGFASAESFEELSPPNHKPSALLPDAKSVIVLACGRKLNEDRNYKYEWGPDYLSIFIQLKEEVKRRREEARPCIAAVKQYLTDNGFKAVTEPHGWTGNLYYQIAVHLAGLGVLGKGNFMVHPQLGAINVLACILTDAPTQHGTPLTEDVCKECLECIKACKYGAFRREKTKYEWIGERCRCYDLVMNPVTLKWMYGPCNSQCVNVCPIGREELPPVPIKEEVRKEGKQIYTCNRQCVEQMPATIKRYFILPGYGNDPVLPDPTDLNDFQQGAISWQGFQVNYLSKLMRPEATEWMTRILYDDHAKEIVLVDEEPDVTRAPRALLAELMMNMFSGRVKMRYNREEKAKR
jgi:epoxyqueuosine reductase QueG